MSASEKLKALEAQPNQMAAAWHIAGALPQIVAVVEAAEEVAEDVPTIARPIPAALAALEEVLT